MLEGYYKEDDRPLWRKVIRRFFPAQHLPIADDLEGYASGSLDSVVDWHADWKDRLRVLVSGHVRVRIQHKTDVFVRRVVSQTTVHVEPPC